MSQGIEVVGLYVRDQDEALAFYVEKLGFRVHTDVRNGDYRWLTVQHPDQPSFQLGLFTSLTKQEQDAMLRETLQEISNFKKDLQGIIDAWKTGDTQALQKLMLEAMRDYPQLHKKLLIDRNKQWVDKLQKLHASGKTVFVVVGAAHLIGKDSVIDLLSGKGLKARQL